MFIRHQQLDAMNVHNILFYWALLLFTITVLTRNNQIGNVHGLKDIPIKNIFAIYRKIYQKKIFFKENQALPEIVLYSVLVFFEGLTVGPFAVPPHQHLNHFGDLEKK